MSEYKRLTERYIDEQGINCVRGLAWDGEILHRLAELEDRIENGTLVPKYSIVDCGGTYCVCTVDTNNLFVIDEYETKAEAEKRLEEIRNEHK